jgi:hypothetical protein
MRSSPCGNHFRRWERCVAANKGDDENGESKFIKACYEPTLGMQECIGRNQKYFDDAKESASRERELEETKPNHAVRKWIVKTSQWEGERGFVKAPRDDITVLASGQDLLIDLRSLLDDDKTVYAVYVRGSDDILLGAAARDDIVVSKGYLTCSNALPEQVIVVDGKPRPMKIAVFVVREEGGKVEGCVKDVIFETEEGEKAEEKE